MKKIISILLILCSVISMSACQAKTNDFSDEEGIIPEGLLEETPEEITEPEPEPVSVLDMKPNQNPPTNLSEELSSLTLDSIFSELEVIVVTKGDKEKYELSDFPEADAFQLSERNDYFSKEYYPQYLNMKVYSLLLNKPSKENALETAKKLMDNPNVQAAGPSRDEVLTGFFYAILTDEAAGKVYEDKDFPELDVSVSGIPVKYKLPVILPKNYFETDAEYQQRRDEEQKKREEEYVKNIKHVQMKPKNTTLDAVSEQMKLALKDSRIKGVVPAYKMVDNSRINIFIKISNIKDEEITMDYFPYIEGELLEYYQASERELPLELPTNEQYYKIRILLKNTGKNNAIDALSLLAMDERIDGYDSLVLKRYLNENLEPYTTQEYRNTVSSDVLPSIFK